MHGSSWVHRLLIDGTLAQLATQTLSTTNGLEESHLWRGRAYLAQGKAVDARVEFEAALKDNPNFAPARDALNARPERSDENRLQRKHIGAWA